MAGDKPRALIEEEALGHGYPKGAPPFADGDASVSMQLVATRPSATPTATPQPTPQPATSTAATPQPPIVNSPTPQGYLAPAIPVRLLIPAINLDAPIVTMDWSVVEQAGQQVSGWDVPNWRAAGWLKTSALVGAPGNTGSKVIKTLTVACLKISNA